MKRLFLLIAAVFVLPACGDLDTMPTDDQISSTAKSLITKVINGRKVTGGGDCAESNCAYYYWYEDAENCNQELAEYYCIQAGICNAANCVDFSGTPPDPYCQNTILIASCFDAATALCECLCNND